MQKGTDKLLKALMLGLILMSFTIFLEVYATVWLAVKYEILTLSNSQKCKAAQKRNNLRKWLMQ